MYKKTNGENMDKDTIIFEEMDIEDSIKIEKKKTTNNCGRVENCFYNGFSKFLSIICCCILEDKRIHCFFFNIILILILIGCMALGYTLSMANITDFENLQQYYYSPSDNTYLRYIEVLDTPEQCQVPIQPLVHPAPKSVMLLGFNTRKLKYIIQETTRVSVAATQCDEKDIFPGQCLPESWFFHSSIVDVINIGTLNKVPFYSPSAAIIVKSNPLKAALYFYEKKLKEESIPVILGRPLTLKDFEDSACEEFITKFVSYWIDSTQLEMSIATNPVITIQEDQILDDEVIGNVLDFLRENRGVTSISDFPEDNNNALACIDFSNPILVKENFYNYRNIRQQLKNELCEKLQEYWLTEIWGECSI